MRRNLHYLEFRQRVFNRALLECLCKLHGQILNGDCECQEGTEEANMRDIAARMCANFYSEELKLPTSTVAQTQAKLAESCHFLRECGEVAEEIADNKVELAKKEEMEIPEDQEVELSEEDHATIDQLFDSKAPTPDIEKIRDATVSALLKEDEKAQEIKDAIDIAKSQVASGENPKAMEETVHRLDAIGPTSLMNAIINSVTVAAVHEVNEAGNFSTVSKVMADNRDGIKDRATAIYALYEMAHVFGIHRRTPSDIKALTLQIYADKRS